MFPINVPLAVRTVNTRKGNGHKLTYSERYDLAKSLGDTHAMGILASEMIRETLSEIDELLAS
jgi:hypothetical protein